MDEIITEKHKSTAAVLSFWTNGLQKKYTDETAHG